MSNNYKWETVGRCKFYTDGTTCTDIEVMDELENDGFHVFMQAVPTSKALSTEEIRRNFNK